MEYKKFDELLEYIQPTKYIVDSENYDDSFPTPVLTAGKSFILGYTDETNGIYFASKENPIILFDDFTTECKLVDFSFKVKSSACKILKPKKDINIKYVYYAMKNIDIDTALHKRYWISIYSQQTIPFPIPIIQENIVSEIEVINETIEYNEHKIKYLEELIKSQFIEMFDGKYESKSLYKVCEELFAGGDVKKEISSNTKSEVYPYPIYTNGEKDNGLYGYTSIYRVDKEAVTISGRGTIGFTCLRNEPFYPAVRLIVAVPNQKVISGCYLKYFIESRNYGGQGTSIHQLTVPMIKNELIPLPPIEEQNKFANFVKQIDKSKLIVQQEIKLLNELLKVKTNEYFS